MQHGVTLVQMVISKGRRSSLCQETIIIDNSILSVEKLKMSNGVYVWCVGSFSWKAV